MILVRECTPPPKKPPGALPRPDRATAASPKALVGQLPDLETT